MKLRKIRVLGIVLVLVSLLLLLVAMPNMLANIPVSDSGFYILAGYGLSGFVFLAGLFLIWIG